MGEGFVILSRYTQMPEMVWIRSLGAYKLPLLLVCWIYHQEVLGLT